MRLYVYRVYNTKNEFQCRPWTLGDFDVKWRFMNCNEMYQCGVVCYSGRGCVCVSGGMCSGYGRCSDSLLYFAPSLGSSSVSQSCLTLCSPWTVVHQVTLPMGFLRQKYWSAPQFPSPGIFPTQGFNPWLCISCIGRQLFYPLVPPGSLRLL